MNCIVCKERGDVVVHVENDDPMVYCDGCRIDDRPEARFKIVSELRLTRTSKSAHDVAIKLTMASCLSIRSEDVGGVPQSVLDAISKVLEENGRLREENRKAVILVQGHGRELRKSSDASEAVVIDHADETKKAEMLTAMVKGELGAMVERVSREIGVDRKWVLSDIVYLATQRIRQTKDPLP